MFLMEWLKNSFSMDHSRTYNLKHSFRTHTSLIELKTRSTNTDWRCIWKLLDIKNNSDLVSHGLMSAHVINNTLWHGPSWLSQQMNNGLFRKNSSIKLLKKEPHINNVCNSNHHQPLTVMFIKNFSSLHKLKRVAACWKEAGSFVITCLPQNMMVCGQPVNWKMQWIS